jgi:hypothetical protein
MRWVRHTARIRKVRNAHKMLLGIPEGNRPLGRPRCREQYNIKMDLKQVGCEGVDWINVAQDRV